MLDAKQFADMLTFSRLVIGLALAWVGFTQSAEALPVACWLLMASWTSDILDGGLARRSRRQAHTWIGDHDLEFDMLVSVGVFVYLAVSGFMPMWLVIAYPLAWALAFWHFGLLASLGKLFQAPIYGYLIVTALMQARITGLAMVAWILGAVIVTWPRFPQEVIPSFLDGMRDVGRYLPWRKS